MSAEALPVVEPDTSASRVKHKACCLKTVAICGHPLRGVLYRNVPPEDQCVVCVELIATHAPCTSPTCPLRSSS